MKKIMFIFFISLVSILSGYSQNQNFLFDKSIYDKGSTAYIVIGAYVFDNLFVAVDYSFPDNTTLNFSVGVGRNKKTINLTLLWERRSFLIPPGEYTLTGIKIDNAKFVSS